MIVEDGRFRPDYTVHHELTAIDMVDVAAALDPDARHPHDLTATGGSGGRIDRGYATRELKDALRGYWQAPGGSVHEHFMIALSKSAMSAARRADTGRKTSNAEPGRSRLSGRVPGLGPPAAWSCPRRPAPPLKPSGQKETFLTLPGKGAQK